MNTSDANLTCQPVPGSISGGAHPPELHYPQVDDSHSYIGAQLYRELRGALGARFSGQATLVADALTEEDIAGGRLPSYRVVYQAADGRLDMFATANGTPLRFRGDPDAAATSKG